MRKHHSWKRFDFFAQTEHLNFHGERRHGTVCGLCLSTLVTLILLALLADQVLGYSRLERMHAHSSSVIDYQGVDREFSLNQTGVSLAFGLYDLT